MAPKPENTVEVAIALDKQSAAEYARQVGASQSLMQAFVQNVDQMGAVSQKSGDKLSAVFAKASADAHKLADEAKQVPLELDKAAKAAGNLQEKTSGGGLSLSTLRMGIRSAAQLNIPGADAARAVGEALELGKVITELGAAMGLAGTSALGLVSALGPVAIIAGGIAAIFVVVSQSMEKGRKETEAAIEFIDKYYEAIALGTSKDIIAQIKKNEMDKERLETERDALQAKLESMHAAALAADPEANLGLNDLYGATKPLVDAIAAKTTDINKAQLAWEALYAALHSSEVAANDAAAAADKLNTSIIKTFVQNLSGAVSQTIDQAKQVLKDTEDRNKRIIDVQKKYTDDVKSINEKDYQARIDLSKKFADQQIAIAEKALADSEAALSKLLDQQEKLKLDYTRNEAQIERKQAFDDNETKIKAQVEETKALRDHLQELQDIQAAGRRRERDFLLNRNFLGLYLSQQQTTDELADSNKKFVQTQKDATEALQQQADETTRQRAFERQERLIAYQERLDDAQAQYKRELQQIDANKKAQLALAQRAYNAELTALTNKTNQELTIKQAGYVQELTLAAKTAQQRLEIQQQTDAAYLAMANNTLAAIQQKTADSQTFSSTSTTGQTITRFASGGNIRAGQQAHVNEPGSSGKESFGTLNFPGEGIFMPFHSGTINPNAGGNTINATFNIDGSLNPEKVGQIVNQKLYQYMRN